MYIGLQHCKKIRINDNHKNKQQKQAMQNTKAEKYETHKIF